MAAEMDAGLHVKCPLLFSFKQYLNVSVNFSKFPKYEIV
jgi:hypothetical protein